MFLEKNLYTQIKATMPILCVDLLLVHEGCYLLVLRENAPARKQWWFPGGRVYKGERLSHAATRKGREELGVDVEPREIVSVEQSIFTFDNDEVDTHTVNIVMQAVMTVPDQPVRLDTHHSAYAWHSSISPDLHPCVRVPLQRAGFKLQ